MSRKIKVVYYVSMLILGSVTFYFNNIYLVVLLMALSMSTWFIRDLNQSQVISELQEDTKIIKSEVDIKVEVLNFKLKELINAIPSPLVYINQRGGFELQNAYFKEMINMDPKNVYDIAIDPPLRQILLDAFLNEKQFTRKMNYQDKDFQVHSIPIMSEDRNNGCMLIFQDISLISGAEKMQKQFIADASHELKTPITSIKGMIEILNRPEFNDKETKQEFLLQTEIESNRLNQIVEDLLLQSRLRENKVHLEKTEFNVYSFFEQLLHDLRHELNDAQITVKLNCPLELSLYADQFRLGRVFINLLNNSISYSQNGNIEIDCKQYNSEIEIRLSDNGKGIKEELIPHIFERFFRGEPDRNREIGGSGLGLAISKSIIEAHDGTIIVESIEGKGSQFIIKLTQY